MEFIGITLLTALLELSFSGEQYWSSSGISKNEALHFAKTYFRKIARNLCPCWNPCANQFLKKKIYQKSLFDTHFEIPFTHFAEYFVFAEVSSTIQYWFTWNHYYQCKLLMVKSSTVLYGFQQGGRNSSFQYGNSLWQHPGSATVNSIRIAVLFQNKVHLKLFEGCKAAPWWIFA